ncbi:MULTISPECIES: FCD domain-containing protein [unclassified Bradyrhizobium]|uniref:GntR family transcriptional regulator n=1 Tax=unclassified Bradyrhizobium TaxID=2631580 RepID=UPI002916198F|nr:MULTISPECIES: FCD domain-containing protein [unclassified Bradyrhizobium]
MKVAIACVIRILLEPLAAQLAAERGSDELAKQLESCNRRMAGAIAKSGPQSIVRIQEANRAFHHLLLDSAGAPRLWTILDTLIEMPIITRSFQLYTHDELKQSLHQHEDLTQAVASRNGELARDIM